MQHELDIITIIISVIAIIISGVLGVKGWLLAKQGHNLMNEAHKLSKKYHGFEARQRVDEVISTSEFKLMKRKLVKKYFILKKEERQQKIILSKSDLGDKAITVEHGFNKVCSWYREEEWVDRTNFDSVYAGYVVNSWNLLKDDIFYIREKSKNEEFCIHFQKVAEDFEKKGLMLHSMIYGTNKTVL